MRRHFRWLIFAIVSLPPCPLQASGEPDAFVLNGIGARPGGMGGAFVGLADDIETIYYNPAALAGLSNSGATAMFQVPSLETSRSFVGAAQLWHAGYLAGGTGFGWVRLRSDDIEITSSDEKIL